MLNELIFLLAWLLARRPAFELACGLASARVLDDSVDTGEEEEEEEDDDDEEEDEEVDKRVEDLGDSFKWLCITSETIVHGVLALLLEEDEGESMMEQAALC